MAGCDLVARTAVIAVYCSEVSYADLTAWLARSTWGRMPPAELNDASASAWWLAGELFRVYAHAATEYRTPTTFAIRDALLALVSTRLPAMDADACLIGVAALLEYEDDGRLFDRLVAAILPRLDADAGSPLLRGWVWYRIHRCARSIGPVRGRGSQRIDAAEAEARAFGLAERSGLRQLRAVLLVTRCFYAHVARDVATAERALRELGEATDFQRPLPAAWYYFLRGLAATRDEEETQALLYFGQAVEAADSGELPWSSQQNFVISHATALAQTGRWAEAFDRFDRLIAQQSGRDRDITECRRLIAEFHRALAEAPEQAPALRAALLARARAIRWLSFGLLTPRSTARFLADALREGQAPDFIAQVVRQRGLSAEPDYPRAWPWPVRIESLGPLRIAVDDAPVAFGSRPQRKPLELLMLLIALGPHPAPSDTLMDSLWPGADGDKGKGFTRHGRAAPAPSAAP